MHLFPTLKKLSRKSETQVFAKAIFDIYDLGRQTVPDPNSAEYALLAIEYWRRQLSLQMLAMRGRKKWQIIGDLRRIWKLSLRLKQATISAQAIQERYNLLKSECSR